MQDRSSAFWSGFWDVVSKASIVAIPVVLGWALNLGSQRIADSIAQRDFIQSLIDELSDTKSQARQDIALILLKEYIGNEQPKMVARIAEVVFSDNMNRIVDTDKTDNALSELQGSTAYQILAELNPERAKAIAESSQQRVLAALLDEINK
ncbi:hypothetical protein Mterra_03191 [Calidithermus terrae]|uniref:Uncharacterized protein n=1 Tax=Calidithermus terrae TaxID=1408545 RepID=A0A399ECY7_9DEIN|nr:hypothetical protein [Calidithermus terrae]RIH81403.1 hypothetical protein Mterra_03191 [Calidithermus terrae]